MLYLFPVWQHRVYLTHQKYFSNLDDFKDEFGNTPLTFSTTQHYPTEIMSVSTEYAPTNSFDQSFIYACELLNMGLPIIFERLNVTISSYAEEDIITAWWFYNK